MNIKNILLVALSLTAFVSFSGCKKDEETAGELITTIEATLSGQGVNQKFYWNDLDGEGGANPVADEIKLPANTDGIVCTLKVYDRSKTPESNITDEINAESDAHLFTYTVSGANLTVAYDDKDSKGQNFGLQTRWKTGQISSGMLKIKLFHEPNDKNNLSLPGGEEDFSIDFPVRVQ